MSQNLLDPFNKTFLGKESRRIEKMFKNCLYNNPLIYWKQGKNAIPYGMIWKHRTTWGEGPPNSNKHSINYQWISILLSSY